MVSVRRILDESGTTDEYSCNRVGWKPASMDGTVQQAYSQRGAVQDEQLRGQRTSCKD